MEQIEKKIKDLVEEGRVKDAVMCAKSNGISAERFGDIVRRALSLPE